MVDLFFRRVPPGKYWELFADISQRSCGESRSEYQHVAGGYTETAAKALVDAHVAAWESGSEPKPKVCPTCGQTMKEG